MSRRPRAGSVAKPVTVALCWTRMPPAWCGAAAGDPPVHQRRVPEKADRRCCTTRATGSGQGCGRPQIGAAYSPQRGHRASRSLSSVAQPAPQPEQSLL